MKPEENESWQAYTVLIIFGLIGALLGAFGAIAFGPYMTVAVALPLVVLIIYAGPLKDWTVHIHVDDKVSKEKSE